MNNTWSFELFVCFVLSLLWSTLSWKNIAQLALRCSRMCSSSQLSYLTFSLFVWNVRMENTRVPGNQNKYPVRKSVEKFVAWILGFSGWFEKHMWLIYKLLKLLGVGYFWHQSVCFSCFRNLGTFQFSSGKITWLSSGELPLLHSAHVRLQPYSGQAAELSDLI